jgi:hypothetical protein
MSSDRMIDPYDPVPEAAAAADVSPNLQADSAESIVLALAAADPLAFVAAVPKEEGLGVIFHRKYTAFLECVLCHGEIPHGHTDSCPWWRAECYKKERGL